MIVRVVRFVSIKKAAEITGFSSSYLRKLHADNPDSGVIVKTPSGGPVFDVDAYENLILRGNTYSGSDSMPASPPPLGS